MAIERFEWSGRNRQDARHRASRELALAFDEVPLSAFRGIHIVAHSHGGNIAVRAAQLAPHRIVSITTLGTPYIVATERTPEGVWGGAFEVGCLLNFILVALPSLLLVVSARWPAISGLIFGALWLALSLVFARLVAAAITRRAARVVDLYGGSGRTVVPTLPIFVDGDEAQGLLHFAMSLQRRVNGLAESLLSLTELLPRFAMTGSVMFIVVGIAFGAAVGGAMAPTLLAITLLGAVAITLFLAIRMANWFTPVWTSYLALGADTFRHFMHVKIVICRSPEGVSELSEALAPRPRPKGFGIRLRHSQLCFDDRAIAAVIAWIRRHSRRHGLAPGGRQA